MKAFDPVTYWRYGEVTMPYDDWAEQHLQVNPQLVAGLMAVGQARGWFGEVTPGTEGAAASLVLQVIGPRDPRTGATNGWMQCGDCGHPWYLTGTPF